MGEVVTAVLLVTGSLFMLLAAVGVLRLPDVFTRMQATSKAATLGIGCMMLAVAVHFGELGVVVRAVGVIVFTFFTAPVGAHMIGRAAYIGRGRLWEKSVADELRGRYDPSPGGPGPPGDNPPQGPPARGRRTRRRRAALDAASGTGGVAGSGGSAGGP